MPTTTNFGWTTPADTDLVKDGALAIRTLGNGIDTSLVDLKGGTTGQVLSKTSNTDMDFTWVTTDDANAIQNSIVDAKADLITATAADVPARLAVGANETRLVADSATATGLKYVADTTNYAIAAKGDLLAGTAADTLSALTVGTNEAYLKADSTTATGLKWDYDSWTSYTPTIAAVSGTFTTASATGRYKQIGKTCIVQVKGTITTVGTGSGCTITVPFTSANQGQTYIGAGRNDNDGITIQGRILPNDNKIYVVTYANGNVAGSGNILMVAIVFEIA